MREIKFRARHKATGVWWYGDTARKHESFDSMRLSEFWGYIHADVLDIETVGQYTELKDKSGKEIYEGDILVGAFVESKPCQVVYRPPTYLVQFPYYNDPTMLMVREMPDKKHREVIGNIYENPELLEN